MGERVINLQNKKTVQQSEQEKERAFPKTSETNVDKITWTAEEYASLTNAPQWFIAAGVGVLALAIVGILMKSFLFSAFIILAFMVNVLYKKRAPRILTFTIDTQGVLMGTKLYAFSQLKSFWIFERPLGHELSLETSKPLTPFIRVSLGEADSNEVRTFLKNFIPEEIHKEFLLEHIAERLGF